MPYFKCQQAKIYYEICGQGIPLVLLHGNQESHYDFQSLISYLSMYQCICMDMRGHGNSSKDKHYSLSVYAQDVIDGLKYLGIDNAYFFGFSDGASVAIHIYLKNSKLVKGLILCGANIHPFGVKPRYQLPLYFQYLYHDIKGIWNTKDKEIAKLEKLMILEPFFTKKQLALITCDVLLLVGSDDMISKHHTKRIQAYIKNSQLQTIEGDHFIAYQKVKEVSKSIITFIEKEECKWN